MSTTETQSITDTKLERIAFLSQNDSTKEFRCLMHHFNEESLKTCFYQLDGNKAVGIDRVDKKSYGHNLDDNLKKLISNMKQMSYRPAAIRQVSIPKEGKSGAFRSLGISNFEDKLVQKMMQRILESIYEPLFLDCSYGFRQGRSCHDAIKKLRHYLYTRSVQTVIDVDLENFFGTLDHQELVKILQMKIKDNRLIRYIIRMLKSGVMANGEMTISEEGAVQGSICSPILANILAHYAIDQWFEEVVKTHCKGKVKLFRYCDDLCICCEYESDALRVKTALAKRLTKFTLKMNEEKTKLVTFDRKSEYKTSFNFLGFTFYFGKSQTGIKIPKLKTEGKRMRSKLKKVNQWAKEVRNQYKLKTIWQKFCIKLEGHIQYYGVSFNIKRIETFLYRTVQIMFKWLNRRSQKKSFTWEKFQLFLLANPLPRVRVCHKLF
ncbi:group II intron reverse transcriptase/maturase [Candidatus Tisiphia endosymbiont of Micropterix aruncella]|uniref:group II intron reverse transcriptase/maturase n=2 Tax=Candidatus Tisiphia endosymbiont of Micropterix aruncella TaxID=3066271 RepID=UPI003AA829B0